MIKSIFYTRFHPEKGSRVLHQVPDGSITSSNSPCAQQQRLFDFPSISDYIIPRQEFCDRLVTVSCSHYRVIGYPVCITNHDGRYDRNQFIFNFAFVVEEDLLDWGSYASVVRKLGKLLRNLEEQGGFLSKDEELLDGGGMGERSTGSKVYALCEMILEDLNNYCECMIPIDDSNTINLKLFPTHLPPAPIHAWHVPLLTIDLASFTTPLSDGSYGSGLTYPTLSADLTLTRILPHVNGLNSVSYISQLADTDLGLTRKAIQHLVYYDCVVLLDIFQFGAMYAATPLMSQFFMDEAALAECARYVRIPRYLDASVGEGIGGSATDPGSGRASQFESRSATRPPSPSSTIHSNFVLAPSQPSIPLETLILLYSSLRQGLTLRNWVLENAELLQSIDVRRLVSFGVIKGFLYRVHKYAITTAAGTLAGTTGDGYNQGEDDEASVTGLGTRTGRELPLARYLDGLHCFDEICTELGMGEREVLAKMRKGFGDVLVVNR
ncbi:nitrogen permease regulator 2 [Saccharata proteae CBS 121410]|uniref:Nitrogen permease regulator 2 n=1 Tax=Saccharata proteae CBS 121410 TaxID=1314787 RepID=A0A9P4I007_9PEZI|nr:nitrogen permease regulator 2 [Saccharata proteae CBS 121410]